MPIVNDPNSPIKKSIPLLPTDIKRLRSAADDNTVANKAYNLDPQFRSLADHYFSPEVSGKLDDYTKKNLSSMLLNLHYYGKPTLEDTDDLTAELSQGTQNKTLSGLDAFVSAAGFRGAFPQVTEGIGALAKGVQDIEAQAIGKIGGAVGAGIEAVLPQSLEQPVKSAVLGAATGGENSGLAKTAQAVETGLQTAEQFLPETTQAIRDTGNIAMTAADVYSLGELGGAKIAKGAASKAKDVSKYGIRQATGLQDDTIDYILKNANIDVKQAPESLRLGVADKFSDTLKQYESAQYGLLPEYSGIRTDTTNKVVLSKNPLVNSLEEKGLSVSKGKNGYSITKSKNSRIPLNKAELSKVEEVLNLVDAKVLTNDQFLNIRGELTKLSQFDASGQVTKDLRSLARELRKSWNDAGKPQIGGLEQLDSKFSDVSQQLEELASGYTKYGADGSLELTDTGYRKLLNITNRGRERELAELKKFIPDIEDRVKTLRAIEDIVSASGNKVGTYQRVLGGVFGSLIGSQAGAAGTVVGGIAGALLTSPDLAIPLIRSYGKLSGAASKTVENVTKSIKAGKPLTGAEKALMTEAINHFDDVNEAFNESLQ